MTAVGYAVITISSQSIAAVVPPENRVRVMAIFVGALMAGTMCGTAIGAILADWLGYKPVFLIATFFSLLAGLLGWSMLNTELPVSEATKSAKAVSRSPVAILARNSQFVHSAILRNSRKSDPYWCAVPIRANLLSQSGC